MIKLLIADDEPLVCVGVQSMLRWEEFDIEIVGTARNGQQAADMIEELRPDIVISDIKMPLKTGLELAAECRDKYGRTPLFIMLTSFEEFEFVRKAISYQAVDYLVKLELDAASLSSAITKAISILREVKEADIPAATLQRGNMQSLREKFFMRLYNNLFEGEEHYRLQKQDLGIDLSADRYAVGFFEIAGPDTVPTSGEKLVSLCSSTVQMARETLNKYIPCHVTTMDMRHFAVAFCLEKEPADWRSAVRDALTQTASLLHNYFNISLLGGIGYEVDEPRRLSASFYTARQAMHHLGAESFVFYKNEEESPKAGAEHLELIRSIRKAFEELDNAALYTALTDIAEQLGRRPEEQVQAMDTASNILYLAFSLLPDGQEALWEIFSDQPDGYRALYRMTNVEAVVGWLCQLRDGCCERMQTQRQSYKQQVVHQVQAYIQQNLDKKLTLNEVAAVFNFSPNYLSQLFAKYAGEGFVEYITGVRINAAREMLARGEGKIYEIAERLGFESSFYFSKVFKKVEGVSPREYLQRLHAGNSEDKNSAEETENETAG